MGGFKIDIEHVIGAHDRVNIAIGMVLHEEFPDLHVEVQEWAIVMSPTGRRIDAIVVVMVYGDDAVSARMCNGDVYTNWPSHHSVKDDWDGWAGHISDPNCMAAMVKYIGDGIERRDSMK